MQRDPKLAADISHLYAFLDLSLAQMWGTAPGWPDFGDNPMGVVRNIGSIRAPLEAAGVPVPEFVAPDEDPMGHMAEWRDFLGRLITVH